MDVLRNSKIAIVEDFEQKRFSIMSFQRGDEALVQFSSARPRSGWNISAIEIGTGDAGRLLERLREKTGGDPFKTSLDEIHLTAYRRNSGEPYSEGFEIGVSEIAAGNDWGSTIFGGYFEDGYHLDKIKEVLQHCVELDQTLKAAPTPR